MGEVKENVALGCTKVGIKKIKKNYDAEFFYEAVFSSTTSFSTFFIVNPIERLMALEIVINKSVDFLRQYSP